MRTLAIDLETYSDFDIKSCGLYKYAENSEILLFAYAWDDEPVQIVDLARGEEVPDDVLVALTGDDVLKTAFNAAFERAVLRKHYDCEMLPRQWQCTMVLGYTLGLPGSLDKVGKVLHMTEDKQKLTTGKRLIQYFCKPCRATKANGGRTRNLPEHAPDKWELFKEYCVRDVEAERAIRHKLMAFPPLPQEQELWALDQRINDYGVQIDRTFVDSCLYIDSELRKEWMAELVKITKLDNPNSRDQILRWLKEQGHDVDKFDKAARAEMLQDVDLEPSIRRVIELKELLGKTSIKKYEAMKKSSCYGDRCHGMLQFYGASRTGRWAGRVVQLQNLPQNHIDNLDEVRSLVRAGDYETVQMLFDNPSSVLSQLIRTAFIAGKGKRFIVADFSAIEARVIAWIAGEQWRMDTFAKGGDIYCASASQMFHVPVEKHGINGHLRQKGKVAELACGYGGGVNALKAFGADKMGMTQEEMEQTIKHWRKASPSIVKMWGDVETCAKKAIRIKNTTVKYTKGIEFTCKRGFLFIKLPSGRRIAYPKPAIKVECMEGRQKESIVYHEAINGMWVENFTWGGKLVENIVQATARDCLAHSMLATAKAGYQIVMHIHDEMVIEAPDGVGSLEEVCDIMGQPIPWAKGLLLTADGYETPYYRKD